jgi:hypothetical protein
LQVAPSSGFYHPATMLTELYIEAVLGDEELADLIEWAFLDSQIDGETQALAFAWLESNDIVIH